MRLCGREFSPEIIAEIGKILTADPSLSRHAVSLRVCELLQWKAPNGTLKQVSCRKALLELDRQGLIRLPAAQKSCFRRVHPKRAAEPGGTGPEVECTLEELGTVQVNPVSSRYSKSSKTWNSLMQRFHYLGKGPLCGAQIRYLVESSKYGLVAALAFSAAQWRLKKRDQYIGWTEAARRANLNRVVCNSRFLIPAKVRVPNLASHVLSQCVKRLAVDWKQRYGYEPVLAETFVDPRRFAGTCYQAGNWVYVGQTAADDRAYQNGKVAEGRKDIYVHPIRRDWKKALCREPKVALGDLPRGEEASGDWTEEEFGRVQFFDERLKWRLMTLAGDFFAQPGELIPQACSGSKAKTKAAYRFFQNSNVDLQKLLRAHIESTIDRLRAHKVILAVQDTTSVNYTAHPFEGIGPIGDGKYGLVGLLLHDTMAFTTAGTPLGLLDVQCWARDPEDIGKKHRRQQLPIEAKESNKWLVSYRTVAEIQKICPDTVMVSIGDREADLYELFHEAAQDQAGPKLLIRAERTRSRKVIDKENQEKEELWKKMGGEPVAGLIDVAVPHRGSRPARTARVQVRFAKLVLNQPTTNKHLSPVSVWAVYAREVGYSTEVKEPIDWMILTTVETKNFEDARERLNWYARRWGIEVYHRTIKSGCRIEDRRLDDADSIQACLAIDLVVAWRVYWLAMMGREKPETPCDQMLSQDEWRVLCAWATGAITHTVPGSRQAMHWIGKLGGWLSRGESDNPGTTCIWRGLIRLPQMAQGYRLALELHGIRAGP